MPPVPVPLKRSQDAALKARVLSLILRLHDNVSGTKPWPTVRLEKSNMSHYRPLAVLSTPSLTVLFTTSAAIGLKPPLQVGVFIFVSSKWKL